MRPCTRLLSLTTLLLLLAFTLHAPAKNPPDSSNSHGYSIIADPKPQAVCPAERDSYAYFKSFKLHVNIYSDGHIGFVFLEPNKHYPDQIIVHLSRCPALHALNFDAAQFTPDSLKPLKILTEVDSLDLANATDAHLAIIANMTSITAANLNCPAITDAGLKNLNKLKQLHLLRLNNTAITDAALDNLPNLPALTWLEVSNTALTDAALKRLAPCTRLQCLHLAHTKITDAGLANFKNLASLENLDLSSTAITDNGLATLASFPALANLKDLYLNSDHITDDGMIQIAKFNSLGVLDLRATNITDAGLHDLDPLKALYNLLVNATAITPQAAQKFQVGRPPNTIDYDDSNPNPKSTRRTRPSPQ